MLDQYGRKIDYLRVSVTDRCNLRCTYCMPQDGVELVRHEDILTYDEILRVCGICAKYGISKIKLTGGEPLVRKGLASLVLGLKTLDGIEQVTLTTNGTLLAEQLSSLMEAGLDAVNISLDTLDEEQYHRLTRQGKLSDALSGLQAALDSPGLKVKINCVILPKENQNQWIPLAELAKTRLVDVRFIEMMPIGLGKPHPGGTQEAVCGVLESAFGKPEFLSGYFGNGPAVYAAFPGFRGKIGFISAMSHQFCESCNRVRLTSEGILKPCLQYALGADLRKLLRKENDKEELERQIESVIYKKPRCHQFLKAASSWEEKDLPDMQGHREKLEAAFEKIEDSGELERRMMSRIGG